MARIKRYLLPAVPTNGGLAGDVRDALAETQGAAREVLESVRSLAGTRPVDLMAGLEIDLKLAWKIARIAQSSDPFECVRHLPGVEGWAIWLAAAARRGATRTLVIRADGAFRRAHDLGIQWAGSRQAFTALAAGMARGADTRLSIEQRRQCFQAVSQTWGMRASLAFRIDALAPSASGSAIDCATVRGFVDLERMRAGALWRLEAPMIVDDRGERRSVAGGDRLEAGDRTRHPPFLLRSFSSDPLPSLTSVDVAAGPRALVLGDGPVGPESRCTLVHGAIIRSMQPRGVSPTDHGLFQIFRLRTAVEEQVFDLLVHRDLAPAGAMPEAILYGDLWRGPAQAEGHDARDRLPIAVELTDLGASSTRRGAGSGSGSGPGPGLRARLRAWPRHGEAIERIFERTGWRPQEFLHVRASIAYPPIPSSLALELPV